MAYNSIDPEKWSPEEIELLQKDLLENPIDTRWDKECKTLDNQAPIEQLLARGAYEILEQLGKLPKSVPKWEHD